MPDGVVQWFDPATGEARVARAGRLFPTSAADMEPVARHPGARVHFDVRRTAGVERAVAVELRRGTHVSHHQHQFGTLVGARTYDAKGPAPAAAVHPELAGFAGTHPLVVARAWATAVAAGDLQGAAALYAPDAVVHLPGRSVSGVAAASGWLESAPVFGCVRHAEVRAVDSTVTVSWEPAGDEEPGLTVHSRIAHGQVAEQWVSVPEAVEGLPPAGDEEGPPLAVVVRGAVDHRSVEAARRQVRKLVEQLHEPVLLIRIKLAHEPDPARSRPAVAEVSVDVGGSLVRAHVAAPTMPEALNLLEYRLQDRLEHLAERRRAARRGPGLPDPGEWRHEAQPTPRPPFFDRPAEERQLLRHKTFAVDDVTPEEAAFDMEQLDHDFHLFRDLASGADCLLWREAGGYRLASAAGPVDAEQLGEHPVGPGGLPIEPDGAPVPVLSVQQAIERLDAGGEPHVFFVDEANRRGSVLYRRYDGHYGLITPEPSAG